MSLNWSIGKIKNHDEVCLQSHTGTKQEMESMVSEVSITGPSWEWKEGSREAEITRLHPRTHVLIMASMTIGMGEITEGNWQEFYTRIYTVEKLYGALLYENKEPAPFKPEDVMMHIGLKLNVADETRAVFNRRMMKCVREDAMRTIRKSGMDEQ
jgi:hypothetical protein